MCECSKWEARCPTGKKLRAVLDLYIDTLNSSVFNKTDFNFQTITSTMYTEASTKWQKHIKTKGEYSE